MSTESSAEVFRGTRRYTPTRMLGAGSWGRVYQAYDAERNAFVAVKLLSRAHPDALLRFKREFRALQDVSHPNLVTLYELLSDRDQWFFTMEYVEGAPFIEWVLKERSPRHALDAQANSTRQSQTVSLKAEPKAAPPAPPPSSRGPRRPALLDPKSEERLRHGFGQLVDGLCALHAAGMLHRDVKPSNVLVTPDGRVVLLDFGLVRELGQQEHQSQGLVVGTPAYMSPEQALGLQVREATDWYAAGVLLYEVLTGEVPFEGRAAEMLQRRRELEAPRCSSLAEGVPEDLDALCTELLHRSPAGRPTGAALQKRLVRPLLLPQTRALEDGLPLVGRERELAVLEEAWAHVAKLGKPAVVTVEGASGLGKSALLSRFLQPLRAQAVVLAGRCGETETVPFKAFDGIVDELTGHLLSLPPSQIEGVLPRDLAALERLFPVIRRVETVASVRRRASEPADVGQARRRGFQALRELLARLAEARPVVLAVDDLHWSDADSAALLQELLSGDDVPPVLLVVAHRPQREGGGPLHDALALIEGLAHRRAAQVQHLELAPLSSQAAAELAVRLVKRDDADAATLARESGGSPYLLEALAGLVASGATIEPGTPALQLWVESRLDALPEPSRRLLEVVAVAGRPVDRLVAWTAARLDAEVSDPLIPLKAARLVSSMGSGLGAPERLVVYDDTLAQAVRARLAEPVRKAMLLQLADALAATQAADVETLADFCEAAGETARAAEAAERAAQRASQVLAFDRAAALYARAARWASGDELDRLSRARADALANGGRGDEAASAYLALAVKSEGRGQLALRLRAAEQLLQGGRMDEGIALLEQVLVALGDTISRSRGGFLLDVLINRARIRLRGFKWEPRSESEAPAELLMKVDAYWAAAKGFSLVDPMRGSSYQFKHFNVAMACGEPYRVMRAIALEAGFHALTGDSAHREACQRALEQLRRVLDQYPSAHGEGLLLLMSGCEALGAGRFHEALPQHEQADRIFRDKCPGMTWELTTALQYLVQGLVYQGNFDEVRRRQAWVRAWSQARGELYAITNFRVRSLPWTALVDGEPGGVHREVEDALGTFSHAGYFTQHVWGLHGRILAALYAGDGALAGELFERDLPKLEASGMLRVQFVRVLTAWLAALGPLATGLREAEPVERSIRALEKEELTWGNGLARLLRAGLLAKAGRRGDASSALASGAALLDATGVPLFAAAARRWRGVLMGGQDGAALVQQADRWLEDRTVVDPVAFSRMLCPGPWGP